MPNEPLESIELRFVPATTGQMKALAEKMAGFGNGEQAAWPYPPHSGPLEPPPEPPEELDLPSLKGPISQVTLKEGKKKDGTGWSLWGIRIGETWANTFSNTIGQMAKANKGNQVTLYYETGEKGNKAIELVLADGTRHRTED
jgi:hypothetical protein